MNVHNYLNYKPFVGGNFTTIYGDYVFSHYMQDGFDD